MGPETRIAGRSIQRFSRAGRRHKPSPATDDGVTFTTPSGTALPDRGKRGRTYAVSTAVTDLESSVGHLLGKSIITLRRDCTAVVDVQDHEWANLQDEMRRLVRALTALFNPDQLNYAFLMNVDAQVHLHVIPRYAGARHWRDLVFEDVHWGSVFGQEQRILDSDALAALASEVRDQLQNVS